MFYFQLCIKGGGKCNITIDGYYIECTICLIYGLIWYKWGSKQIRYLQNQPMKIWRIRKTANHSR